MTRQGALAPSQRDVNMPCWKQIAENPRYSTKDHFLLAELCYLKELKVVETEQKASSERGKWKRSKNSAA